ncbi:MAG: hypothetical protein AAFQ42_10910 [Pseudomonadota bacterium]
MSNEKSDDQTATTTNNALHESDEGLLAFDDTAVDNSKTSAGPWGSESGELAVPKPPHVRTRPSLPYIFLGLLVLGGALYVSYFASLPDYLIAASLLLASWFFGVRDRANRQHLEQLFVPKRMEELEQFIEDAAERETHARDEFREAANIAPAYGLVMAVAIAISIAIGWFTFGNVSGALSWMWDASRIGLSFVSAVILAFLALSIAGNGLMIPVNRSFDYHHEALAVRETDGLSPSDNNDIDIIQKAADLQALFRRVETYTLESALLSALSFSSFLSIVLSERDYIDELRGLFSGEATCASLDGGMAGIAMPIEKICFPDLTSLAAVETNLVPLIFLSLLICAAMFLGVLVARLRFNEGLRDAEIAVAAAERLNEKEEAALEKDDQSKANKYALAIRDYMESATRLERELNPTLFVMFCSRNLGILFFIVPLVLCGFFFSPGVAAALFVAFGVSLLFGRLDDWRRKMKSKVIFGDTFRRLSGDRR